MLRATLNRGCLHKPIVLENHPPAEQSALRSLLLMAQRSMGKDPSLPDETLGTELMDRMGRLPNRLNAFRLCVQLGLLPLHANLFLMGTDFERPVEPAAAEEAAKFLSGGESSFPDPDAAVRVDLTHLKVYTIDSADTTEVDDGISVERLPDGRERVWVHIADVSRCGESPYFNYFFSLL
jgi:RNB domain